MEVQAPFGIVTACHQGDLRYVKATLASASHFCPDVPICVIADGDFDTRELTDAYPVIIIRTTEIDDPVVQQYCRGNPRSKLVAMWHGPFDRYIYLDADAIVWGDIRKKLCWNDEDFLVFWNQPTEPAHRSWLAEYYMKIDSVLARNPEFEWMHNPYFSTGAFACRKNVISKNEWVEIEEWRKTEPDLFSWTRDQGILNYLVFWKAQMGQLKLGYRDLQWIPEHRGIEITKQKFTITRSGYPKSVKDPFIMHFCGGKPDCYRWKNYSLPFTVSRYSFHTNGRGMSSFIAALHLFREELIAATGHVWRKMNSPKNSKKLHNQQ
jgi:hypothetical protein